MSTRVVTLGDRLAAFCTDEARTRITQVVRAACRNTLLDFCGVALAGSTVLPSDVMRRALLPGLGTQVPLKASVFGQGTVTWAPVAALLNGASAHSIELDDLHSEASLHPGAIIYPTAMAMAEATGCSGERFVHAVVAGYEAAVRVGLWITPSAFYERGFHPTGVAGVFGATAAAGVTLGLSAKQLSRAFGIASDLSTGLMEFGLSGSWSKRMHTGWPAQAGCVAALLAAQDFVGSQRIFENPNGIIFAGAGRLEPVAAAVPGPDDLLAIEKTAYKRHACCRFAHTALDILLDFRTTHSLSAEDIEAVTIGLFHDGMFLAVPAAVKVAPATMVDAQFSLQYAAAAMLCRGRASLPEFLDSTIRDPQILAVARRIAVEHRPRFDSMFPRCYPSEVTVTTKDGHTFCAERDYTVGDFDRPFGAEDIDSKFNTLARLAAPAEQVAQIASAVESVVAGGDPRSLASVLRGTSGEARTAVA